VASAPKVSVIVPCYNLGEFVTEAVDSVLAQTLQDFEIIVVNDGSTDAATNEVLSQLQRPHTRVLTTENRGLPAARNHAAEHAQGQYICALDADDKLHPEFLEKTIAVLDREPDVAFVSTWVQCFGFEDWVWRQDRCDFPKLLAECVVLTASPVRRSAFEAVGGYEAEAFLYGSEDWDLWIRLVGGGYRGVVLPEVLFYYRQREESMRRVAERGDVRLRVRNTLRDRHRALYERYLPDLLLLKEDECGRILRDNWSVQHEIETQLAPAIAARKAELACLLEEQARVGQNHTAPAPPTAEDDSLQRALIETHAALDAARAEIVALRASRSWVVTAPLRRGYDVWLSLRGRLRGPSHG
jgi:glycosyltransferase involved in cell wall biosynthesis